MVTSVQELDALFRSFDADGNGSVSFDELLRGVQGELPEKRRGVVAKAFAKLDCNGGGVVDMEDIALCFNPSEDPEVKSGKKTEKMVR